MTTRIPDLRLSWPLRAWLAVEVMFGVMSMLTISLAPADTARHFAWPIKPEVTAALLGAFYLASAWVFVLAVFARRWQNVRVFVIPSILFSSTELIATFLHWDRFSVGSLPFNVWFVSYLLPPPLFIGCYLWHQGRSLPIPLRTDDPLAPGVRGAMRVLGAALALLGLVALFEPSALIALMAWKFTPLTARALSGWILALGAMMLSAAHENDRTRARIISPFLVLLLPAVVMEVPRFAGQVTWSHPGVVGGLAVLAATFAIGVYLARGDWRRTLQ